MDELVKELLENEKILRRLVLYLNGNCIPFDFDETRIARDRDREALLKYRELDKKSTGLVKKILVLSGIDIEGMSQQKLDFYLDRIKKRGKV